MNETISVQEIVGMLREAFVMISHHQSCKILAMPKTLKIIPGFILATLGLFAGVGPNEAASHLAEWAAFFGVENVPDWLVGRTADRWGMAIGFVGFIAWGFWYFDVYKTMHSKNE